MPDTQSGTQVPDEVSHEFDGSHVSHRLYGATCTCGWMYVDGDKSERAIGYQEQGDAHAELRATPAKEGDDD